MKKIIDTIVELFAEAMEVLGKEELNNMYAPDRMMGFYVRYY